VIVGVVYGVVVVVVFLLLLLLFCYCFCFVVFVVNGVVDVIFVDKTTGDKMHVDKKLRKKQMCGT